jgi:amidohydrolase
VQSIIKAARSLQATLVADRRRLHANPELGHDLPDTVAFVMDRLERLGIEAREICPSGIVACLGRPGPTLLLRADMDALPMCEATDLPFRARNGFGHCCGHDLHTAMLLGAAEVLKEHEARLEGTVKLMFQPAEEIGTGAGAMLDAGVLDGPKVDAALALHVASYLDTDRVVLCPGTVFSSNDRFDVLVQGRGGHGAVPHLCVDPLAIVNALYTALSSLVDRNVDPFDAAVLTIGRLGGGMADNVIPDTAVLGGGLRCYTRETRERLVAKVHAVIDEVTALMGGTCTRKTAYSPILANDPALGEALAGPIRDVVGTGNLVLYDRPLPGAEDFAFIAERVPSLYLILGAGREGGTPNHHASVVFDEQALATGAALYANCAFEWLRRPEA